MVGIFDDTSGLLTTLTDFTSQNHRIFLLKTLKLFD